MKRRFLAVFAALLALTLTTCDLIEPGARDDQPLFTEDGRPMVRLSISLGNSSSSRAMTKGQAQPIVNAPDGYYEVAFKDPDPISSKIYRTHWNHSDNGGEIAVPKGIYTLANQAILFAGRESDKTLLAIGIISAIDNVELANILSPGTANVAEIFSDTESVTFTLYALESRVTGDKATSSFKILGPTSSAPNTNTDFSTDHKLITTFKTGFEFVVPGSGHENSTDDSSAVDSSNLDIITNIVGRYTVKYGTSANNGSIYDGVIAADDDWVYAVNNKVAGPTLQLETRFPKQGDPIQRDGGFYFNINVKDLGENGIHKVHIEVPVNAIGSGDSPGTWYIRGGLNNTDLDGGLATSTGGAFVLNVGDVANVGVGGGVWN